MADEDEFFEGPCGYFEDRKTKEEIFFIPNESECVDLYAEEKLFIPKKGFTVQEHLYDSLLSWGWRRSGDYFYKETCPHCKKCLAIRLPVADFLPSKSQRKSVRKNLDLEITLCSDPKDFVTEEKIELFKNYGKRHDSQNDDSGVEKSLKWLNGVIGEDEKAYSGTFNMDYRLNGKLVGVGVVDRGDNSLSSNYFYYDISDEILKRSIGVFSVIQEIEACRGNLFDGKLKSEYYYLGYYLAECDKMKYKIQYKPNELLIDDCWWNSELINEGDENEKL